MAKKETGVIVAAVLCAALVAGCQRENRVVDAGAHAAETSGGGSSNASANVNMPPENPPDDVAPEAGESAAVEAAPIAAGPAVDPARCEADISAGDTLAFDKSSIDIPTGCESFTLTLHHTGSYPVTVMGHNLVITKMADIDAVAKNSLGAGPYRQYVEPSDKRVITRSKVIGGGKTVELKIDVAKLRAAGGGFGYFCSFPGHAHGMRGQINLVQPAA